MKKISFIVCIIILFSAVSIAQLNIDFESTSPGAYATSNSVSGWTLSSMTNTACNTNTWAPGSNEFSIVSTPFSVPGPFSVAGTLLASPLGGSHVARLEGNSANGSATMLSRNYTVNATNSLLKYAVAGGVESCSPQTPCCMQALLDVHVKDQNGAILCSTATLSGSSCNFLGLPHSSYSNGAILWTDWQTCTLDLSDWSGTVVTIEFISSDCKIPGHNATLFVDAAFYPQPDVIYFCPGATQAVIACTPLYWAYMLVGPGNAITSQTMQSNFIISNPVSNSVYTLLAVHGLADVCPTSLNKTYTLVAATTSITSITTSSVCYGASNGSSTVALNVGTGGFNYTWIDSNNQVVGTSPVATNLPPGTYTVAVTGIGSNSTCGNATATTVVNAAPPNFTRFAKPVCNINPTLCVTGNNVQWYNGNSSIPVLLGGTASCYTLSNPAGGSIFRAGFFTAAGCRDSVAYIITSATPGSISISNSNLICPGASNGSVIVTISPALGAPAGTNYFSVTATGTTPAYISSLSASSSTSFTPIGMQEGSYNIIASDGLCTYSQSMAVAAHYFNYSISMPQDTVCQGTLLQANVTFTAPVSQLYSYSWTPSTYLFNPAANPVVIMPALSAGTVASLVYSVTVTHNLSGCALTKTLAVTAMNPPTPTIASIPLLCADPLSTHTIAVNPQGGIFSGSAVNPVTGILSGIMIPPGQHTVVYTYPPGGLCTVSTTAIFTVNQLPSITTSGNTNICAGQSTTLFAGGATTYSWNTIPGGSTLIVNPVTTNIYTITGTNIQTNCTGAQIVTVNVQALPVLSVAGNTQSCYGEIITLSASGASTYSWSNGFVSQNISVSPTTTTTYSVLGTSASGNCSSTEMITVIVSSCTGLVEKHIEGLQIYPNPTSGKFFIETENKITVLLSDELGRSVLEETFEKGNYQVDLSNYANGVYILKTSNNRETKITKLVKKD